MVFILVCKKLLWCVHQTRPVAQLAFDSLHRISPFMSPDWQGRQARSEAGKRGRQGAKQAREAARSLVVR
eukprot:6213149-Pleurochrysis_carterae.AAC.2